MEKKNIQKLDKKWQDFWSKKISLKNNKKGKKILLFRNVSLPLR